VAECYSDQPTKGVNALPLKTQSTNHKPAIVLSSKERALLVFRPAVSRQLQDSVCLCVRDVTQCALEMSYWTGFNHFVVWGSMIFYFVFIFVFYSELFGYSFMGTATTLMATSTFWLTMLLSVVLLLFPVVLCKLYLHETAPTLADKVYNAIFDVRESERRFSVRRRSETVQMSYKYRGAEGCGLLPHRDRGLPGKIVIFAANGLIWGHLSFTNSGDFLKMLGATWGSRTRPLGRQRDSAVLRRQILHVLDWRTLFPASSLNCS